MSKQNPERHLGRRSLLTGAAAVAGGAALSTAVAPGAQAAPGSAAAVGPVVVTAGDRRLPDLARGNNLRWEASPEKVVLITTTEQAVNAVREAVTGRKRLTVRSGGHCYEDFVFNKDVQVVVDLSAMNQVRFDTTRNAFEVEAGASNLDLYEKLYKLYGVTLPAGTCASVGVGGHISGGGYGMLSRLHGLTVDYLHGVEVVVVRNGVVEAVRVFRDSTGAEQDLWWAHTGGGGGNFGLITRYWLKKPDSTSTDPGELLPSPPSEVLLQATAFKWADVNEAAFTRLVQNWGTWHEQNSAPNSPYNSLFGLLKLNHSGNGEIGLITQMDATVPDARRLLHEYLTAITAGVGVQPTAMTQRMGEHAALTQFRNPRRLPWYIATDHLSGGTPGLRGKYKSAYARKGLSPTQIRVLYKHLYTTYRNPAGALVQIDSYGGRINSVPSGATAVPQRDSVLKLQFQTYWTDPAEENIHISWIRDLYREMYAETGGVPVPGPINDGCYINYPDKDLGDPAWNASGTTWQNLYYKDSYARLQRVKAAWDPQNFFRHAQSVRLP
ncbi:FAD-binding oxidoreductase [Streptomyces jumonjinensis]|uniref:FAD-dependent oxidoreductase n=1 Tax=Streptomyces jumonjinensis TaxID=1945 RepID=A0A646KGG6_STRJU|nr:FAD-binding protein [Streptomyces jumonjinensis]MQT01160.1 FAD-dependent oxidoreductase [Streptomyces jumonjinensis]